MASDRCQQMEYIKGMPKKLVHVFLFPTLNSSPLRPDFAFWKLFLPSPEVSALPKAVDFPHVLNSRSPLSIYLWFLGFVFVFSVCFCFKCAPCWSIVSHRTPSEFHDRQGKGLWEIEIGSSYLAEQVGTGFPDEISLPEEGDFDGGRGGETGKEKRIVSNGRHSKGKNQNKRSSMCGADFKT